MFRRFHPRELKERKLQSLVNCGFDRTKHICTFLLLAIWILGPKFHHCKKCKQRFNNAE